ncbi:MAG: hypothetical protein ACLPT6_14505 [Desulfobaccales bacterium]
MVADLPAGWTEAQELGAFHLQPRRIVFIIFLPVLLPCRHA